MKNKKILISDKYTAKRLYVSYNMLWAPMYRIKKKMEDINIHFKTTYLLRTVCI